MIELIQITNDPAFARRCDALDGIRLFVDLERLGKAERQAGLSSFISTHSLEDVGRIRQGLRRSRLMVRVDPLNDGTGAEVDAVVGQGADLLMLPMFKRADEVRTFCRLVAGRRPVVALLETPGALESLGDWVDTPGLEEVFVGLNDLHLALGMRFMFEPLARGMVDAIAAQVRSAGLRFGFGGIARMDEGLLPGRSVLAEHVRLGSGAVILSRTFRAPAEGSSFEADVAALRAAERALAQRSPEEARADAQRIARRIDAIAGELPLRA